MVFLWSLRDSKSPQVTRTVLSIWADLNNACSLISKSSSPFTKPLRIVPNTPIIFGITITFMFHCIFNSLEKSKYLSLFSIFFLSNCVLHRNGKTYYSAGFPFFSLSLSYWLIYLFILLSLGLVVGPILGDPFISQNPRGVCGSHSPGQILDCVYILCLNDQISVSCTVLSGSSYPPSRVSSSTLSVLICCNHL